MSISTHQHWIDSRYGILFAQSWTPAKANPIPLILLHGALGCVELWGDFPQRLAISTQHCVIAYDRPGYGRSAALPGPQLESAIADDPLASFTDILDHFQAWDFIVYGHCIGAAIAIDCAVTYPRACKAVIAESALAFIDNLPPTYWQQSLNVPLHQLHKLHGDKTDTLLKSWEHIASQLNIRTWMSDTTLTQIRCPLLALYGAHDKSVSTTHLQHMRQLVNNIQVHILTECGRKPHIEAQKAALELLKDFVHTACE